MQRTRRAEVGPELLNNSMMEVVAEPTPEQPPSWWQGAWSSIEQTSGRVTGRED